MLLAMIGIVSIFHFQIITDSNIRDLFKSSFQVPGTFNFCAKMKQLYY